MATYTGSSSSDSLTGGAEADTIDGAGGSDALMGGCGDDLIIGGTGSDYLYGGIGNDTIIGGADNDVMFGQEGADVFLFDANWGADTVTGGSEADRLDFSSLSGAVNVTFSGTGAGTATSGTSSVTFTEIEAVWGGAGNDQIDASQSTAGTTLIGGAGNDTILGGSGDDLTLGGTGNDSLSGGSGNDTFLISGGEGTDTLSGGAGNDVLTLSGTSASVSFYSGTGGSYSLSGTSTGSFTDIETFSLTGGADTLDASTATQGVTVFGNDGNDSLLGGSGADWLVGGSGNDLIRGNGGNDTLEGGSGADTFSFVDGWGADTVIGGDDTGSIDLLELSNVSKPLTITFTGNGAGTVSDSTNTISFSGIEKIISGRGSDVIDASNTTAGVVISGYFGSDSITGGSGNDLIYGDSGTDTLIGGAGNDTLDGGDLNDVLNGGTGNDLMYGGTGTDSFQLTPADGVDTIDGGEETGYESDSISFLSQNVAVTVTFTGSEAGTYVFGPATGTFTGIEMIAATGMADLVDASASALKQSIFGYGGNDTLIGGSAADYLDGGDGNDSLVGGDGADTINGGAGNDTIEGGAGDDWIFAGGGVDRVLGGDGNDYMTASDAADFDGGAGNDTINGGSWNDTIRGGDGNDSINGGGGNDTIWGGAGNDTLIGGIGSDVFVVTAEAGNDSIAAGEDGTEVDRIDFVAGGDGGVTVTFSGSEAGSFTLGTGATGTFTGVESIVGTAEADIIDASAGSTKIILSGGEGADRLTGGSAGDSITGGAGADTLAGGGGNDTLSGGADADTFVVGPGGGSDVLVGGETGLDRDTLQLFSGTTQGVIVTYGSTEAGGYSDGAGTSGSFSEIERLETGEGADRINASAATGGVTVATGGGSDTLIGGTGNDTLSGGTGSDVFVQIAGGGADVIRDFDLTLVDGHTVDQFDVSDLRTPQGDPVRYQDVRVSADSVGNAVLTFPGGETVVLEGVTPDQVSGKAQMAAMGIPCFAGGTPILTPTGPRPVEEIGPGDLVMTRDAGPQVVVWAGGAHLDAATLARWPGLRPIRLRAGALGAHGALTLSAQHGVLLRAGDGTEALVRARHLLDQGVPGVRQMSGGCGVTYHHLLLPSHQVLFAAGLATESFYPGPMAIRALNPAARVEVLAAVLALAGRDGLRLPRSARPQMLYGPRVRPLLPRPAAAEFLSRSCLAVTSAAMQEVGAGQAAAVAGSRWAGQKKSPSSGLRYRSSC